MKLTPHFKTFILANILANSCLLPLAASAQTDPWSESYRLENLGRYAEAQAPLETLTTDTSKEFITLRSAWLLYQQGKYLESEKRYQRAIQLNPRSIDAHLGLMLPLMAQYRWADTIKIGRRVLEENRWDQTANVRMMIAEEAMSRWHDLARHAAEFSTHFPSDATALVYWARAESALRNTIKAKSLYAQVLERIPGHLEATKFLKNNL